MELLLTATVEGKPRRIGWVSLQPNGSVSVGLNDKTFVSPDFKAKNFLWNAYNRETLHYLVTSDAKTLTAVRNPHLTFHPPHWFHLKANGGKTLFEGIGDLPIMLEQDGVVPWVRFVSRSIADLSGAGLPRKPDRVRVLKIDPRTQPCSSGWVLTSDTSMRTRRTNLSCLANLSRGKAIRFMCTPSLFQLRSRPFHGFISTDLDGYT